VPTLHVLRVFVNEDGTWGNRLGVFLDGEQVPEDRRQGTAAHLGFSETVFIDDREEGRLRIYTPSVELPFAGHPSLGAAWLLSREGVPLRTLRLPAGEVGVRQAGKTTFITAKPEWALPFEYWQMDSPTEVEELDASTLSNNTYVWSWLNEATRTVRARSFVPEAGIAEDEATGSAALALCAQLNGPVTIHQGHGSVLLCRPHNGQVEVGGSVVIDEVREC
jgi:predicted PhzF superfamily epimerase YddE/YHI9